MTDQITIQLDEDGEPPEFWAELDEFYPEIADALREGEATVDANTWDAIQRLEGFADSSVYAVDVAEVEDVYVVDCDGTYEVHAMRAAGFAVVDSASGQVHSEHNDRSEAIKEAERLNQYGK